MQDVSDQDVGIAWHGSVIVVDCLSSTGIPFCMIPQLDSGQQQVCSEDKDMHIHQNQKQNKVYQFSQHDCRCADNHPDP